MMTNEQLEQARNLRRKWPDDYPPVIDLLLAHIDALTAALAAERALADMLYQAMWERMKESNAATADGCATAVGDYLRARGRDYDAALARHGAARQEGEA